MDFKINKYHRKDEDGNITSIIGLVSIDEDILINSCLMQAKVTMVDFEKDTASIILVDTGEEFDDIPIWMHTDRFRSRIVFQGPFSPTYPKSELPAPFKNSASFFEKMYTNDYKDVYVLVYNNFDEDGSLIEKTPLGILSFFRVSNIYRTYEYVLRINLRSEYNNVDGDPVVDLTVDYDLVRENVFKFSKYIEGKPKSFYADSSCLPEEIDMPDLDLINGVIRYAAREDCGIMTPKETDEDSCWCNNDVIVNCWEYQTEYNDNPPNHERTTEGYPINPIFNGTYHGNDKYISTNDGSYSYKTGKFISNQEVDDVLDWKYGGSLPIILYLNPSDLMDIQYICQSTTFTFKDSSLNVIIKVKTRSYVKAEYSDSYKYKYIPGDIFGPHLIYSHRKTNGEVRQEIYLNDSLYKTFSDDKLFLTEDYSDESGYNWIIVSRVIKYVDVLSFSITNPLYFAFKNIFCFFYMPLVESKSNTNIVNKREDKIIDILSLSYKDDNKGTGIYYKNLENNFGVIYSDMLNKFINVVTSGVITGATLTYLTIGYQKYDPYSDYTEPDNKPDYLNKLVKG